MIIGKNKHGDTVKIKSRKHDQRETFTISVIYQNGTGYAEAAGSISDAKAKSEHALGKITWSEEP